MRVVFTLLAVEVGAAAVGAAAIDPPRFYNGAVMRILPQSTLLLIEFPRGVAAPASRRSKRTQLPFAFGR